MCKFSPTCQAAVRQDKLPQMEERHPGMGSRSLGRAPSPPASLMREAVSRRSTEAVWLREGDQAPRTWTFIKTIREKAVPPVRLTPPKSPLNQNFFLGFFGVLLLHFQVSRTFSIPS